MIGRVTAAGRACQRCGEHRVLVAVQRAIPLCDVLISGVASAKMVVLCKSLLGKKESNRQGMGYLVWGVVP